MYIILTSFTLSPNDLSNMFRARHGHAVSDVLGTGCFWQSTRIIVEGRLRHVFYSVRVSIRHPHRVGADIQHG